jgi:hypothetical protein
MSGEGSASVEVQRRRLSRSALWHAVAVAIFGLLAWSGTDGIRQGVDGLAVPFLILGVAGSLGSLVIVVTVMRWRAGLARPAAAAPSGRAAVLAQGVARWSMAAAAVVAVGVGVALAPTGMDRGFVISVDVVLAGALALFALLAGGALGAVRHPGLTQGRSID